MKKTLTLLALLAITAVPTFAGTVYVPLVVDQMQGNNLVTTEIRVTNNSQNIASFTYLVLPTSTDGSDRPDNAGTEILLQPHNTFLLTELVAPGETAMVEIDADAEISVSSRLVPINEQGERLLGAEAPVLTSDNLMQPNTPAYLNGWNRIPGTEITDFHLINLGVTNATCFAWLYGPQGALLVNAAEFGALPVSQRSIADVLGLVGLGAAEDISAVFNCDQPFYPYATTVDPISGQILFMGPSGSGRSNLLPPGQSEPPIDNATVFELPGVFHRPTVGDESAHFDIPMPGNPSFSRIVLDMDFTHGGWNVPSSDNHGIFWLNRGDRWRSNLFGYVNCFGPGRNELRLAFNVGIAPGDIIARPAGFAFQPGQTYHVNYDFNTNTNRITLTVSQGGTPVVTITETPRVNRVNTVDNNWFVVFGHETGAVGPEVPTYGWTYANLRVQWVP